MDYSKLTDKDINKLVAFALGCKEVVPDIFMSDDRRYEFDKPKNKSGNKFFFDPCNNPADAWPIITANKISIYAMSEADKRGGWGAEAFHPNDAYSFNDNPLRAAMIVFLMMQESANVQDNPT
ncbi:phage protein NinX family protein [Enterobacter hormaechei]|uniref:Protein ninX n=2 Tax=Enterobacter hormaechei TaxID=158836 RepID=A0A2J0Q4I2_9ENTR|nr:phage protein NinX family protein [Enterobacter hormaechei]KLQ81016.1 protein ninX [Enterobacter hormaechei subsp. steigerwaltii]PJD89153.1 protein ninX [Enterobacter hormaechei]